MPSRQEALFARDEVVQAVLDTERRMQEEITRQGKLIMDLLQTVDRLKDERDALLEWIHG
jgi:hypothetical protein